MQWSVCVMVTEHFEQELHADLQEFCCWINVLITWYYLIHGREAHSSQSLLHVCYIYYYLGYGTSNNIFLAISKYSYIRQAHLMSSIFLTLHWVFMKTINFIYLYMHHNYISYTFFIISQAYLPNYRVYIKSKWHLSFFKLLRTQRREKIS